MNQNSIDVLLPVGENSPHLKEAIQSILSQEYTNWILFVLIDRDSKNLDLIKLLVPSSKLKIVEFEGEFNLSERLNFGMRLGSSKFIARMDADDLSHKDRFSRQFQFLQNTNVALIGSAALVMNEKGDYIGKIQVVKTLRHVKINLLRKNQFLHPTLMFRRDVLQNIQYDPLLERSQDYGFVLEVAKFFEIFNIPDYLLSYRVHNKNHSTKRIKYVEMKNIGKLKFELAKQLGASKFGCFIWHSFWVIKNIFFSPVASLEIRLTWGKIVPKLRCIWD